MLFTNNVALLPPKKTSGWRKIAIGTWKTAGDPSVYGILELEMDHVLAYIEKLKEKTGTRITYTHFVGRAIAEILKRHPEMNCLLRFGRLYRRQNVDIFFQVASDTKGEDLSGMTVRNADQKSVVQIAREIEDRVKTIRSKGDVDYKKVKGMMKNIPGFLSHALLTLNSFFMYTLNLWSPLFGSPRDAFGGCMITNIGSLGLEMAFAPLVPYSRVPLIIAMGAVKEKAVVRNGKIEIAKTIQLCATFDHRLVDGIHASHMSKTLKAVFSDPEKELGPSLI